jgi:Fe-Mn family superoxide dismutase
MSGYYTCQFFINIFLIKNNPFLVTIKENKEDQMTFELPKLPFAYNELEPVVDALTVEIHYSKHHATYVKNLNTALEKFPQFFEWKIEDILMKPDQIPEDVRVAVKNNGGGYYNHIQYWESLAPAGQKEPTGKLANVIQQTFGNLAAFKQEMEKAGLARFGSGYAWLSKKKDNTLIIHSTANQDSPISEGLVPIITIDVWEHAYYLKYQNRRAEYLSNIWQIIDWDKADKRFNG